MSKLYPEITPGSYWLHHVDFFQPSSNNIVAKVLAVKEDKIHIIRKTKYGFEDLSPETLKIEQFLELYMRLED